MVLSRKELFTRIVSIVQILTAIIITGIGIGITVKFRTIHHEHGTPYEAALHYIDNPWTTKYAAGVWMGLIIGIAGILGMFVDLKPHKNKYKYYTLGINIIVLVVEIVLIVFSAKAVEWYGTCRYVYVNSTGKNAIRDCSNRDKSAGKSFYTAQIAFLIINGIATVAVLVMTLVNDIDLFRNCCGKLASTCGRHGKSTHQFDREVNPVEYHNDGPRPNTYV